MSSQTQLKLVATEPDDPDVLPFERRGSRRRSMTGSVTSVQQSPNPALPSNRICSLQLLDISDTGLGAIVTEAIEPGSPIMIYFPPHGPEQGFNRSGYVVCCAREQGAFRIGIRFAIRAAA